MYREDFPVYLPPSTFEGYGVESVEVRQVKAEVQGEGEGGTVGGQPRPESVHAPQGPVFRIQLEGFAAPFTTSKVVGPEDWLTQNVCRKSASEREDDVKDEEGGSGTSSSTNNLTTTVQGIPVIDSPRLFTLGDVNPITTSSTTNARDNSTGDVEGEAEPSAPAAANPDETLLVFPPSCGLGSEGSVTLPGNGWSTM